MQPNERMLATSWKLKSNLITFAFYPNFDYSAYVVYWYSEFDLKNWVHLNEIYLKKSNSKAYKYVITHLGKRKTFKDISKLRGWLADYQYDLNRQDP